MRTMILAAVVAMSWAVAGVAIAHEGHEHKVMGKVVAVDDKHIEVEAKDGTKVSGVLGPETRYMNGKAVASLTDVKVGDRVVLTVVQEKEQQNVKAVLLGAKALATTKPAAHRH
jgi:hypothetical protein